MSEDIANDALASFRQGDVLPNLTELVILDLEGPSTVEAPLGVVVLSGTCDLVRQEPSKVQVAPLVRLEGEIGRTARDGRRPRFVAVPEFGNDAFADLDVISTIDKRLLATLQRQPGLSEDDDVRRFGRAVGRRPSRYPFPDPVHAWLRPLEEVLLTKSRKPNSPEGRVLSNVLEVRVQSAAGWVKPPYSLTISFVVRPGTLPATENDSIPEIPDTLATWLYDARNCLRRTRAEIAGKLCEAKIVEDVYWLWAAYGQAVEALCTPPESDVEADVASVDGFEVEIVSADEYSLIRYRQSEQLDVDHLSPPGNV